MKMIDQREVVFQTTGHGARDFKKNNVTSKEIEKIISFCILNCQIKCTISP